MEEDEILGKITRLLEQGCTMLATHHECGAPLFRYQGEIVCTVCSFPDEASPDQPDQLATGAQEAHSPSEPEPARPASERALDQTRVPGEKILQGDVNNEDLCIKKSAKNELEEAEAILRTSLISRMNELAAGIKSERDLDRLKKELECAEGLLRVLRLM